MDWEGREFRVLGHLDTTNTQFSNFEIYAEAENGEVVNDAIFRRNATVEDKYNVKITQDLQEGSHTALQTSILAGEDNYDLAFVMLDAISTPTLEGYFYDLYNVDNIDFDKEWWNPGVNESVEMGGKLFFTSSDFSLRDKSRAYIMINNRDMAVDFGLEPVVDLVREGKWTIDKMAEQARTVAADLDNDGMEAVDDRWGLGMDSYNGFALMCYATGNRIIESKNGSLELAMNNEHMINSLEKIFDITCDMDVSIFCDDFSGKVDFSYWSTMSNTFYAGNLLFACAFPHSLQSYSANCNFDYGIVPMPKYDENQEKHLTLADRYCMLFAIPVSTPTPEFSGFMLEALSANSTDTSLYAYYETTCKTKYTYDPDSAEMLDTIFDGIIYDIGFVMNVGGLRDVIANQLPKSKTNNFSSLYASKEASAQTALDKMLEKVAELD